MSNNIRVLAAMSGGVDSSVTAALLLEQGYEVVGATMQLFAAKPKPNDAVASARAVTKKLGIAHHVFDMSEQFKNMVIAEFVNDYAAGCTPNPCVNCNEHLKFGALLAEAKTLGCDFIATGHYVNLHKCSGAAYIKKAVNRQKDQSYFLYRLKQNVLQQAIFPLGMMESKAHVHKLAGKFDLPVVNRLDSQDICFIPDNDTKAFLRTQAPDLQQKGPVILEGSGEILGQHDGIAFYTVGQRKGLGIAYKQPLYIVEIDARSKTIIVGPQEKLFQATVLAKELSFAAKIPDPGEQWAVKAKIRYAHQEQPAMLKMLTQNRAEITFEQEQRAVTPGQSIVFYQDDLVLGGGIICKAF